MAENCLLTQTDVVEALAAAQPLLAAEILDLTIKTPSFLRDLPLMEEFPRGNGTQMQQMEVRGEMPPIERGFDKWAKLDNNTGCEPCEGPTCSYNWTMFGGLGLNRRLVTLMSRDFRSQAYCVSNIQTTAHFQQFFGQIVKNLFMQINFFKEQNVNFNYLVSLAKKYVVDSGGPKPNLANPYVYPAKGTTTLSALNIELLTQFYEYMRRDPSVVPYDMVNGAPVFSAIASPELLQRLYRDDPQLRQDVRFSGLANDLVTQYNFMSTFRGMFINAPILYPRRFRWDTVSTQWIEVLPFEVGIPMEVGSFTGFNPKWQDPGYATHEEVILHGRAPFKIMYLPTETTLGQNTSFGPEYSYMNSWMWVNTLTDTDPFRRVGYFATAAKIGLAPLYSQGIYGILVERDPIGLTFTQTPQPSCPVSPTNCGNEIEATGCPCPIIETSQINPINGNVVLTLVAPLNPVPSATDTIQFGIDTGGYLTGTVVDAASDGSAVEVTFTDIGDLGVCDHFTSIFCDNTLGCSATVQAQCTAGTTSIQLTLSNPIKADTDNDVVTVTYADGTTEDVAVSGTPDLATLKWVLDGFSNSFDPGTCAVPTIVSICVPPGTDATCPDCGGPTFTVCT